MCNVHSVECPECSSHAVECESLAKRAISMATQEGFLVQERDGLEVTFIHDSFQSAAYSLLDKEKQASCYHLKLGRILLRHLQPNLFQKYLFTIADQLARGYEFIREPKERITAARIFLQAGDKYKAASAFPEAHFFFARGIHVLHREDWAQHYRLCCDVYMAAAEVAQITGSHEDTEEWLKIIFEHSKDSIDDQFRAYFIQVKSLASRNQMEAAIDLGMGALRFLVGEQFPSRNLALHTLVSPSLSIP